MMAVLQQNLTMQLSIHTFSNEYEYEYEYEYEKNSPDPNFNITEHNSSAIHTSAPSKQVISFEQLRRDVT